MNATPQPNADSSAQNAQIRAGQALHQATMDSSMDMIQVFEAVRDEMGEIIDFKWILNNHASEKIYGQVLGQSLLQLQPGVVVEGIFDAFKQVVQTGVPAKYEMHYVHEQFDGWFHQSVVKLNDGVATTTSDITERKNAEEQLRQGKAFLQSVIDSSLDIIQVFEAVRDGAGQITDFVWVMNNLKAVEQNGEVIGHSLLGRNPGVVDTGIFGHMVNVAETGIPHEHEQHYTFEQFDGWFYQALVKTDGGVVMTTRDITRQKRDEQEIFQLKDEIARKVTDKYQTLFNSIDQGFNIIELIFDENGTVIDYWQREHNPVFTKMTGLKDAVGKRMSELVRYMEPEWHRMIEQIYHTGEPVRVEYPVQALGQWYAAYMSRVGDQGSPFIACLYDDITERKREEQRQAYLLTLSDALRSIADPVSIEQTVTSLALEQFAADRCYYATVHDDGNATVRRDALRGDLQSVAGTYPLGSFRLYMKIVEEGKVFVVENAHTANIVDEDLRQLLISLKLLSLLNTPVVRNGKVVGILSITQCVPRRWTALEMELASETAERVWAAVERAKAEEALQLADRRKDEFLAMLAHELRNPMSTIRSGLQLLALATGDPEMTDSTVAMMNRQSDHLVRMVDDLLDVSRISHGKIELRKEHVDLAELTRQSVESVRLMYAQQGRRLHLDVPITPVPMEGDATRLIQIVTNLLTNGARYTDHGGQVWLSLHTVQDNAVLRVADDGIGLDAQHLASIFEIFVQVDNSVARPRGGLGLGLTLVKRLVDLHGGQVSVHSAGIGQGSTFTVRLPVVGQ